MVNFNELSDIVKQNPAHFVECIIESHFGTTGGRYADYFNFHINDVEKDNKHLIGHTLIYVNHDKKQIVFGDFYPMDAVNHDSFTAAERKGIGTASQIQVLKQLRLFYGSEIDEYLTHHDYAITTRRTKHLAAMKINEGIHAAKNDPRDIEDIADTFQEFFMKSLNFAADRDYIPRSFDAQNEQTTQIKSD
ncbi:MAG: hypothetical protein Q8O89_01140 [Nanoarchaeota archaeon]|nr:hypothetical protein [Nanoarchaeota archaeon]